MATYHTKAKIKLNNEYTEQIEVKNSIKQETPINNTILHCNGVVDEKIRDKRKYNNMLETSLCLCGRCYVGNKNQTDSNKYFPEAKAGGREVWISNKSKQNI